MKNNFRIFSILIIVSLLFLVLDKANKLSFLKQAFSVLNNPARRLLEQDKQALKKFNKLDFNQEEEIKEYKSQIAVLKSKLDLLRQENNSCQKLLQSPLPADWHFVLAHSLGVENGILSIDRGIKDGIKEGDTVLVENLLLARVKQVFPKNSQAELIFSSSFDFQAKTLDSQAKGIVKYDSRLDQLFLTEVSTEKNISKGEVVVITGKDGVFPPNLVVGEISEVQKVESDIYQKAIIKSLFDINSLDVVFVRI